MVAWWAYWLMMPSPCISVLTGAIIGIHTSHSPVDDGMVRKVDCDCRETASCSLAVPMGIVVLVLAVVVTHAHVCMKMVHSDVEG